MNGWLFAFGCLAALIGAAVIVGAVAALVLYG